MPEQRVSIDRKSLETLIEVAKIRLGGNSDDTVEWHESLQSAIHRAEMSILGAETAEVFSQILSGTPTNDNNDTTED